MKTSKRNLTALLSLGMITVMGQAMLLAQTNTTNITTTTTTTTTTSQPSTSAPTNATPPPAATTTTTTTPAPASDDGVEFHKGEINVSPFGTYVDQSGGKWGAGVAGTYFLTDKIGIGAATYWTETGGTFFDNVEFEGYFRLPLKRIAPYAVASLGYQFDREYWFETFGAGLDFRAFKRFDAFADVQYRIANSGKSGDGALLRVGMRFNIK